MSNMKKLGTCLAIVALAILALIVIMPDAYALPLTGPSVPDNLPTDTPVPTAAGLPATHTIKFTTATPGLVGYVDITFPTGFDVSGVGVGTVNGIGADGTVAAADQVVTYTVTPLADIAAGTAITIPLTSVVNALAGNYNVTVATRNVAGTDIDGPTLSAPFAITAPALVNLIDTVDPLKTNRGETATHTIGFKTATKATIASVDIIFPAGFDVSGVAVGTPTGITAGTVAAAGQMVTYTVTTPAEVVAGTAITIPLTSVVNAPAGNYKVVVLTKDATPLTIDGPTLSAPFTITAVPLTNVTYAVAPAKAASSAAHTIGFKTATKATIKSVDITFLTAAEAPAGFDFTSVAVGAVTNIGAGTVAVAGQKVTYTVTTPVEVAKEKAITIKLTGVVNGPIGNYKVEVATKDATPLVIDGPTKLLAANEVTIEAADLKNVGNTVVPATVGQTATHTIAFTQPAAANSPATIKSVDITFPANFDVSGVGVGTVANIGVGTVAATGQVVTYTVTTSAPVTVDTAIEIPLTNVVNAPIGKYKVKVETKDDTGATIGKETESTEFEIKPKAVLTSVSDTVVPPNPGVEAGHTIAFTQPVEIGSPVMIKSVDITFPSGFDVSGVVVGTVTGIGAGTGPTLPLVGQVVTYKLNAAEELAKNTAITIPLTGVINATAGTYTVKVETKDDTTPTPLTIGGPTSASFEILTPGSIEFFQLSKYYTLVPEGDRYAGTRVKHTDGDPLLPVIIPGAAITHYTTSGVFPGDFDDTTIPITENSKPDQSVIGALKRGADNVPIMKVVVTGNSAGSTFLDSLTLSYTGLGSDDLGTYAVIYQATYHDDDPNTSTIDESTLLKSALALKKDSISVDGTATFQLPATTIDAGTTRTYVVVLDIASGAGSNDVDMRVKSVNLHPTGPNYIEAGVIPNDYGNIGEVINPNPDGYAHIDASAPALIVTADVTPEYDTATKVLTLKFTDGGGVGTITKPRVNVIADSDGNTAWKVDLSKIKIRAVDDSPSLTNLTGASFLYYKYDTVKEIWELVAIPSKWDAAVGAIANQAPASKPDFLADGDYYGVVRIKLTSAQDAFIQDDILPEDLEIYMNGALTDLDPFLNAIGEIIQPLYYEGDITPPLLVEEKPVSFDYKTQILTLTFNESIDASEVESANIYIMNYVFDPEADADPDIPERIIVDLDSVMDLRDASVEEGYGVTVSMTLTPAQRDILKGDHPQVYLDDGAVEDIAGNPNDRLNSDIVVDSVDEFIKYIDEKYIAGEYPDIGAADAYVTPPILSGVDSRYNGNLEQVKQTSFDYPDDYHNYDAVLELKFTEELSTDVDATKITVTNENGEQPFALTQSRYDSILSADSRIVRLLLAKRSKTSQKAKIAFWQLENSGIDELHIEVGAKAVEDIYGNSNELMEVSKRIHWLKDSEAPRVTDSTSYGHTSQVLKLAFDECIDLESDNIDELVDLSKVDLEAYDPDNDYGLKGESFTLNEDEDLIKAGQKTGVYLSITLSDDHRDIISSWDFAGGSKFILKTNPGAVYDIVGNNGMPEKGDLIYSGGYPVKNWSEDTVKPTFVSPAHYSIDEQMLVLRFSEPIYDGDIADYKPDLSKIKVHPAAEKSNIKSLEAASVMVSGDALKINLSGTDVALVDVREILEVKKNPQVDVDVNAVYDLAKNWILRIEDRSVTLDVGGPKLSSTGNTYEHISLDEEDDLVTDGLVTLSFAEVIEGKSIKLSKIKLQAGTTSVDLSGAKNATGGVDFPNSTTFKMKITDDDKVGRIASLQRDYDTLHVALEAEAVADLAGNLNVAHTQAFEKWTGDSKQPEIKLRESYYIHDLKERSKHYARLVLVFDEPMDTSPESIDASGVVVTDGVDSMIALSAEEIKPDQDLSTEIQFNLTDAHRKTISFWGEPKKIGTPEVKTGDVVTTAASTDPPGIADTGGLTKTSLSIYLAANSVTDTAGNSVVVSPSAKVFAKVAPYKTAADERKYDKALAADATKEEGKDYSSWEKDLKPAEFVSAAYNANTRVLTITFDELMDVSNVGIVDSTRIRIYDANYPTGDSVDLAGGATEAAETNTVTVTLTPEKGVAVKELKTPLYIQLRSDDKYAPYPTVGTDSIFDVGPARDIAGNPCEAIGPIADTKISYTKDTTKPALIQIDGVDGSCSYWHSGNVLGSGDITGLLTLVFNEGVNKDHFSIDATKIRLSNTSTPNSGFVLTQDEIHNAPGYRVYPLATAEVDTVQFDLNDEHWNTVANEKWSGMYIHMDAGAISDTAGYSEAANAVAAVVMAIHADRYNPDSVGPDVRVPAAPIATAPAGKDLIITSHSVTDESTITEVRLYYQVGGSIRTYVLMENTTGNAYEGTIPGTAVTNKGLCYYIWAIDLWDNTNITPNGYVKMREADIDEWFLTPIPGGFNVKVTGTSVELPANKLPAFDAASVPSTYRMISVPITPLPAATSTTLFEPFGVAGIDWVSWQFTGGPEYNGYDGGHIDPFTFSPGVAAWVGTVNPDKALIVTGEALQISDKASADVDEAVTDAFAAGTRYLYEITLSADWNQIAVPFNFSRNWDKDTIPKWNEDNIADVIYWFSGEKSSYSFASLDSTVPNQDVFETSWIGSGIPDNELVWNSWPGSLDPWGGYWIYSNREGAVLKIDPTIPGKGVLPATPTAPSVEMPYNWSVKVMPEAGGTFGTAKFAGIVSDASDGIDNYDVMDLPALPGQVARLAFIVEDGDYLQDMKAPADEMFWNFKASAAVNTPVTLRFDASDVPSEYRTVLLIDTVTEAATDLRKASSYAYKSSEKIRNFKLIISKAHIETYIVPKHSVLLQNYPNPFNPETWVPYRLSTAGDVNINIYNIAGQLVRTLELGHREAGSYTVKERSAYWDGRNATGERVASGVYFYNIQSGSFHATKRMVIVK